MRLEDGEKERIEEAGGKIAGGKIAVEPAQQVRWKLQGGQGFKEGEMGSQI